VEVLIRSANLELFKVIFYDVNDVKTNKTKDMMIYSITEIRGEEPLRNFVFVNWDEQDDAYLEIIAKSYTIKNL
jgi:hypothetical protein